MQATDLGLLMDGLGADGILGLGFTASSQIGGNSPFVQGVNAGDISGTFYSIWLEHFNQTDDLGTHGVIYYGGFDPVHCAPNPTYVPLASAYAYQLTMSSFKVVGSSATNSNNKYIQVSLLHLLCINKYKFQTYLDTTTAQIGLPKTYISQVFDSLGISTNVMNAIYPTIVPCNTKITLTFGFVSGMSISVYLPLVLHNCSIFRYNSLNYGKRSCY